MGHDGAGKSESGKVGGGGGGQKTELGRDGRVYLLSDLSRM